MTEGFTLEIDDTEQWSAISSGQGSTLELDDGEHCRNLASTIQRSSALFLMGLKEEKKLTQTALQECIEGETSLSQSRLGLLRREVCHTLKDNGVSEAALSSLDHLFDEAGVFARPFFGLETQHQQIRYYSSHFDLIVSVT